MSFTLIEMYFSFSLCVLPNILKNFPENVFQVRKREKNLNKKRISMEVHDLV